MAPATRMAADGTRSSRSHRFATTPRARSRRSDLPWSVFPGLCGVYALSHVTGLVTLIAPGGLGVREGVLSVQLGRLIAPGLAEILAVGVRLWFTLIELICLGVVLAFCPRPPWGDEKSEARDL